MIRYEDLCQFDATRWQTVAEAFRSRSQALDRTAGSLEQHAERLRTAWSDQTGQQIAERLAQEAEATRKASQQYATASEVLTSGTTQMSVLQQKAVDIGAVCRERHLIISPLGEVVPDPDYWAQTTRPEQRDEILRAAKALNPVVRDVLARATQVDEWTVEELAKAFGTGRATASGGPLDLSDAGIQDQIARNRQGALGHCAFLSPLLSIGAADPSFVRRHVVWDEASASYRVTLYDKDSGQPTEVLVDPTTIDQRVGRADGSGEITYLSVYQQAVLQEHPDISSYNFELTQKIVRGEAAPESTVRDVGFSEVRASLNAKPPGAVMVATPGAQQTPDASTPVEKRVVPGHAYSVSGFDSQGRIVLRNPWGADGTDSNGLTYPAEVHLTEEEYRRYLHGVTVIDPPM